MSSLGTYGVMRKQVFVSHEDNVSHAFFPRQAHTNVVVRVEDGSVPLEACDALLTTNPKLTLGIHTRDCAPICFGDGTQVAVAHVGWRGLCGGIIENVLAHFEYAPGEVFVGPFLHSFEIQKDACYDAVTEKFGKEFLREDEGRLLFDFKGAIASLLPSTTAWDGRNTEFDQELPSYRHKRTLSHIITTVSLRDESR